MKLKLKQNKKEYQFEIQDMNALDYYNITTKFRVGQIDFIDYAQAIISECVVEPSEARNVKYFETIPKLLDVLVGQIGALSKVGLTDTIEVETIE